MVTQRTEGLYRLFLLCQIVMVAVLFWFGVWIMVTFLLRGARTDLAALQHLLRRARYRDDYGVARPRRSKNYFMQNELLRPHRLSLRQTIASIGAARPLPDRDQGRIHFPNLFLQLRPVALCRAALLALLSPVVPGADHLSAARRENFARRLIRQKARSN